MATNTGFGKVKYFNDFSMVALDTTNDVNAVGTTATIAYNAQNNGAVRLTSHTDSGDTAQIRGALSWNASKGICTMEARVTQVTALTLRSFFIGWTDDATTEEIPINLATATFTGNAANSVGFVFNTAATDGSSIYAAGSKASVTSNDDTDVAIAAVGTWQTFRVDVDIDGNAVFSIDGKEVSRLANAITANTDITWCVCHTTRTTAASSADVDYVYAEGSRE